MFFSLLFSVFTFLFNTYRLSFTRVLATALCLCPSVTSWCSIETAERIGLVLAQTFLSTYPILCCKEIQVSSKQGYFPLELLFLNSGFRKFRHGIGLSIVKTCYRLSARKVDAQSVINWAVVGQLS